MLASTIRRMAIVGNAGGGKTSLARWFGQKLKLPVTSIDDMRWAPGWKMKEGKGGVEYAEAHAKLISQDSWVVDGLGDFELTKERLARATDIVFIDMSVDEHIQLAKRRAETPTETAPQGCSYEGMTDKVIDVINNLNGKYIPELREYISTLETTTSVRVHPINSIAELDACRGNFSERLGLDTADLEAKSAPREAKEADVRASTYRVAVASDMSQGGGGAGPVASAAEAEDTGEHPV